MKVLYKADEFQTASGAYHIICDSLVGTGRNWVEPARILDLHPADFIILLKNEYNAIIEPFRDSNDKLSWVGYHWNSLAEARKFKNFINAKARQKNHLI